MIAIDLGSNSLRVIVYECSSNKTIFTSEKVVKTADGLDKFSIINNSAIIRIINAIQDAQEQVDFAAHTIRAVTTEAMRRATNHEEVLHEILEVTGVHFEIISGDEEARLTLDAVKNRLARLKYHSDSFSLVDIGGGSTEVTFFYKNKTFSKSFPIGIVTIAQRYGSLENIKNALPSEMLSIQMFCAEIYALHKKTDTFVATAGTPTTVAAMKLGLNYTNYDANKINGISLTHRELDFYLDKLLGLSFNERELEVGIGRSDLIAAGILIYKRLYTILEFDTCIVVDDGLREGVVLEECVSKS